MSSSLRERVSAALALGTAAALLPSAVEPALGETTISTPATRDARLLTLGGADEALVSSRLDRAARSSEKPLAPVGADAGTGGDGRCPGVLEQPVAREAPPAERPAARAAPAGARTPVPARI
jgi:hypothetical protein